MTSVAETVGAGGRRAAAAERGAEEVVRIASERFGVFEVATRHVLTFAQGLIGFPAARRFVILDHRPGSPFKWMLSLEEPDLAFAVADPAELVRDYRPPLTLAARTLEADPADVGVFVILTIPPDPTRMTANLMAPIVVDVRTRRARQLILDEGRCDPSYSIFHGTAQMPTES
jgi:flagellar assembly factor FliW